MVTIVKDRDLIWDLYKYDVILVGVTIYNTMPNGFPYKIRNRFPETNEANLRTRYGDTRKYGTRMTFEGNKDKQTPIISLLYIAGKQNKNKEYINRVALKECLKSANAEFAGKKVATTLLGSSKYDGNCHKRNSLLRTLTEHTKDIDLTIYDYEQMDKETETKIILDKYLEKFNKEYGIEKLTIKQKSDILKRVYLRPIKETE